MARCLTQTPEKVAAVISVAETAGVDRGWVQIACLLFLFDGRRADDGVFEYGADVGYGEQSDRVLGNEENGVECARCGPC